MTVIRPGPGPCTALFTSPRLGPALATLQPRTPRGCKVELPAPPLNSPTCHPLGQMLGTVATSSYCRSRRLAATWWTYEWSGSVFRAPCIACVHGTARCSAERLPLHTLSTTSADKLLAGSRATQFTAHAGALQVSARMHKVVLILLHFLLYLPPFLLCLRLVTQVTMTLLSKSHGRWQLRCVLVLLPVLLPTPLPSILEPQVW